MSERQRIELYCLCWNDARMLPHFFRHYDDIVDRYYIYDNGSTDGSLDMLAAHGRVEVTHFDTPGDSFVAEELRLSETIWQTARGRADWVLVIDIDEHIYHTDLKGYLRDCAEKGITAIDAIGYEMVSDAFPAGREPLYEQVTEGVRADKQDKLVAFNPDAVIKSNYQPGRHEANPEGRIVRPARREVQLLHFKHLGMDYLTRRSGELLTGLKDGDIERDWGIQYTWNRDQIAEHFENLKQAALPVPGLGVLSHIGRDEIDDEETIRQSGLFDTEWYLRMYKDIKEHETDPLAHYCSHGWHEGRRPNFYFDTELYLLRNPKVAREGRNPLVHYATIGQQRDQRPSDLFFPRWYRRKHGLSDDQSALRHYLEERGSRKLSPMPEFDVAAYCAENEAALDGVVDPFEHYVTARAEEDEG
ncbi:MAG TPA: glycosyltransferase family 2 protein [Alphaproteobacteria bacterium]|nr:glycosyltransferase family 2 protein [Alphaproteobacteria bacterium]